MNTTSVEYKYFLSSAVTVEQQFKPKLEQVKMDRRNTSLACCLNAIHDLIESDSCDSVFEPNHLQEKVEEFMEEETSPEINNEQMENGNSEELYSRAHESSNKSETESKEELNAGTANEHLDDSAEIGNFDDREQNEEEEAYECSDSNDYDARETGGTGDDKDYEYSDHSETEGSGSEIESIEPVPYDSSSKDIFSSFYDYILLVQNFKHR